jgi:hypothetical protein
MSTEDNLDLFNAIRVAAMLTPPLDPLYKEVSDTRWADYGRRIHENLTDPRFVQAVFCALASFNDEGKEKPQHHVARRLRLYLTTGTIA